MLVCRWSLPELGGGGGTDPVEVFHAELGVKRCLAHVGIIKQALPAALPSIFVETRSIADNIYAPVAGLFDRQFQAGDQVEKGQLAGYIRSLDRSKRGTYSVEFFNEWVCSCPWK
jgi:predicted deacylase